MSTCSINLHPLNALSNVLFFEKFLNVGARQTDVCLERMLLPWVRPVSSATRSIPLSKSRELIPLSIAQARITGTQSMVQVSVSHNCGTQPEALMHSSQDVSQAALLHAVWASRCRFGGWHEAFDESYWTTKVNLRRFYPDAYAEEDR